MVGTGAQSEHKVLNASFNLRVGVAFSYGFDILDQAEKYGADFRVEVFTSFLSDILSGLFLTPGCFIGAS